jgi:hypothetical protein
MMEVEILPCVAQVDGTNVSRISLFYCYFPSSFPSCSRVWLWWCFMLFFLGKLELLPPPVLFQFWVILTLLFLLLSENNTNIAFHFKKHVKITRLYMQILLTRLKGKHICSKSEVKYLWFYFSPWTSQPHQFEEHFNMILSSPKPANDAYRLLVYTASVLFLEGIVGCSKMDE